MEVFAPSTGFRAAPKILAHAFVDPSFGEPRGTTMTMTLTLASIVLTTTSTVSPGGSSSWSVEAKWGAQVFLRARRTQLDVGPPSTSYSMTRARLLANFYVSDVLRITLEPDFAAMVCSASGVVCQDADLSDAFVELAPLDALAFRVGQAKTPYGLYETTSEWRLPALRRGLVSDLVTDRLGFGGRHLGARARIALRDAPIRPTLEAGVYADPKNASDLDGALRVGVRLVRGGWLQLAGYLRAQATADAAHGSVGALSFEYDRGPTYVGAEAALGRARRLSIAGVTDEDATFVAARVLGAYAFSLSSTLELEPYVGLDLFDPNAATKDDLGGALRGGLSLFYRRMLRVAFEAEARRGEVAFVAPNQSILTVWMGASLE